MSGWPTRLTLRRAPEVNLPLRFMSAGTVGFLVLSAFVAWQAPALATGGLQTREMLVATHLFTLGWGSAVVMGALLQLLPVIAEVPLHSPPLGHAAFWLYVPGAAILVGGFWFSETLAIAIGGTLVVAAMHFFLWNARRTLADPGAKPSVTGSYLRASLTFFGLTLTWGFALALNYHYRFFGSLGPLQIAAHASLGLGGWFTLTAIGVTYRLIPMFAVAHGYSERAARPLLWALATGVGGLALTNALSAPHWLRSSFLWLTCLSVFAYLAHAAHMLAHRRRARLDLSMRFALAAWAALGATAALLLLWDLGALPRWIQAIAPGRFHARQAAVGLGYLGTMGWVSLLIVGMMYKIVPFLVWYARYRAHVGKRKTPLINELWSQGGGALALALLVPGVAATAAGLGLQLPAAARAGALLALAGALAFAATMAQVIAHRPPWERAEGAPAPTPRGARPGEENA